MGNENINIHAEWYKVLQDQFESDYFKTLKDFLVEEKATQVIYPPDNQIFSAFDYTPFSQVKVVILGQDPYHGAGQAHGMCFSVQEGITHPPSLRNIYKEIESDLGIPYPQSGHLVPWAQQGVFLLNATLTVRAHQAGSHQKKGWETFTNAVIKTLSDQKEGLIFILWGKFAIAKSKLIDADKHYILQGVHPSPLSAYRGFFGCKHFSKANELLNSQGKTTINWEIQ